MNSEQNKPIKPPVRYNEASRRYYDSSDKVIMPKQVVASLNEADALRAENDEMRGFIESMEIVHFADNGKMWAIYRDGETVTMFGNGTVSQGHTHVWNAYVVLKDAGEVEGDKQNGK